MISITIPSAELYDEVKEEFVYTSEHTLKLEHSLVSLSKWESHYKKPFLTKETKTREETVYYVKCMTMTQNVPEEVYAQLSDLTLKKVTDYIEDSMTATTFGKNKSDRPNREIITAELIYYWMIAFQIPFECQRWHLNRLLTLVRVCSIKNQQPKKGSKAELMRRQREMNAARKAKLNTKG